MAIIGSLFSHSPKAISLPIRLFNLQAPINMFSTKRTKTSFPPCQILSSASAEIIANNDDLLMEILLRLPFKSLLKFKSVSKHWLSLISNPHLSQRLNPRISSPSALFVQKISHLSHPEYDFVNLDSIHSSAPFKSLTFAKDPSGIKIIHSCNGLLLCCSFRTNPYKTYYYIYNPTTKQYSVLPRLPKAHRVSGVTLAYDPEKSPHYKVVCVRKCDSLRHHYQIEMYSSRTGPWRVSGSPFAAPDDVNFKGVFCNGAIHWISDSGASSLCFDVDHEQLKEMPMPQIPDGWDQRRVRYFGESCGHLYLVEIYGPRETKFIVREMERDYSGWFVKYRVDLDGVVSAFPEMIRSYLDPLALNYHAFQMLCIVGGEKDEDSFMVLHLPGKLIRYNFRDNSFKKLSDIAPPSDTDIVPENAANFALFDAYEYVESFACV